MRKIYILVLCLTGNLCAAQQRLTLQDAIARALQYNYDIRMADVVVKQADANNTMGNAGMLPDVAANAGYRQGTNNVFNQLSNGTEQIRPNAATSGLSASVDALWTVFDGGRMFVVKKQLGQREELASVQYRLQVQTTVSQVIQAYAEVVWRHQQQVAIDTGIGLAATRMNISRVQYESGSSAKVDFLQATVDHNLRRTDSLNQQSLIYQSLTSLNVLLGEESDRVYVVDDSLQFNIAMQPLDKERLQDVNLSLNVARRTADIFKLDAKIARAQHLPIVTIDGSYAFTRNTSAAGFALFSRSFGPSAGVNINIPLYRGGNIRRQVKVASLEAMRYELAYDKQNTELSRQYRTGWRNYELSVAAYNLQSENIRYAKENVDIQRARFRAGIATTLETREAESSYVQALVSLYTAAYNVKVNETVVLELENRLVQ
ncbi:MAG: TolC family protein [Flavipsychrobacter sp.]|nr:TolC family protein [Flavipsychrobacter sp.]